MEYDMEIKMLTIIKEFIQQIRFKDRQDIRFGSSHYGVLGQTDEGLKTFGVNVIDERTEHKYYYFFCMYADEFNTLKPDFGLGHLDFEQTSAIPLFPTFIISLKHEGERVLHSI